MRGLTPAERAQLAWFCDGITGVEEPVDDATTLEGLVASGRVQSTFRLISPKRARLEYTVTDAGRLALRLWPATAATPGAGGG